VIITVYSERSGALRANRSINTGLFLNTDMAMACRLEECGRDDCVQLTDREASVCITLCSSKEPISFSELRHSSGLHQEILSRIVRRLTIHGLVAKVEGKYQGRCGG
jgi:DNA-binding HxlR family transcriptional regulator